MNVIAGIVGGAVGAALALTVRLIVAHPRGCAIAALALIALAKGVPGAVVLGALGVATAISAGRRVRPATTHTNCNQEYR